MDNSTQTFQPNAFDANNQDCRPQVAYWGCAPEDITAYITFYWVWFGIHALGACLSAIYTLVMFGGTIFCFLMTDPYEYGVPPSVVVIFYNLATNNTALAFVLLLCAWAELLNENNIKVSSSGWLNDYKKHFFMACLLRLATQSVFGCLSAGNPNDSYRIIHRIWLIDWAWILFAIGIATFVLVSRLIRELRSRAAKQEVVDKMTRLRLLVGLITAVAGVACVVHAIILEIVDRYPWLSMICISVYHGATKTGIIWIIIVKPQNVRSGKTTKPGNSTNATQTVNSLQESSGDR